MERKALIVGEAAGPLEQANSVLQRFGFGQAASVGTLSAAASRLRNEHFDLVFVPLQGMGGVEMTVLEREIRREGATFIIGTAPQADPDLILRAMRAGVHEFLVAPPDATDLTAAVDRLVRRNSTETQRGLAIAVYSAKGGLGTTSVAVNLAYALARNIPDRRVALVDFVVSGGDVRVLLNLKPAYDIGDLVMKVDRIDEQLLFSLLTPSSGGVWSLPASENPEVQELLDGNTASAIIAQLRTHFGCVVIDCEHHMSDRTLSALDAADRIVVVTELTVQALRSTQRTLELCERLGYQENKVVVVVNRHQSGDQVSPADAADVLGREIFFRLPNEYKLSAAAMAKGAPVVTHDPNAPLAKAYLQLAAKLGGSGTPRATANGTNGRSASASGLGRLFRIGRKG